MIASVVIESDPAIIQLFSCEDKELSNNRASYTIKELDGHIHFDVTAKDAVALRATLTSITKTLIVYEKMKALVVTNDEHFN